MRITDLLDKRSISLDGAPKNKQEALDMAIELMNGVSHMLPFVVGGGILIALAFLIDGLCVDMNALAPADRANFGTITPIEYWWYRIWIHASGTGRIYRNGNRRQTGTCSRFCGRYDGSKW